jgi:hypothetical protein
VDRRARSPAPRRNRSARPCVEGAMHSLPALPPTTVAATAAALVGCGTATPTAVAVAAATADGQASTEQASTSGLAATWRLAYLITGDRTVAHRIVDDLLAAGVTDPAALRRAVLTRARAHARGAGSGGRREALWTALQRLPRRERAAIVARLAD